MAVNAPCASLANVDKLTLTLKCTGGGCADMTLTLTVSVDKNGFAWWGNPDGWTWAMTWDSVNGTYVLTPTLGKGKPLTYACDPTFRATVFNVGPDQNGCTWDATIVPAP